MSIKLIEVILPNDDSFLKIKETLTRIGVASRKSDILYQSCHILHKQGKYYIVHFKELFLLDGKDAVLTENDIARRNTIIDLLDEWKLLKVRNPSEIEDPQAPLNQIKVLSYKEKNSWELKSKYQIGQKRMA